MKKLYVGGKYGFKQGNWALVDDEDYGRVSMYNWSCSNKKCPKAHVKGKTIVLSRFILKYDGDNIIDHKDCNTWNNQKYNLRIVPDSYNQLNKKIITSSPQFRIGLGWRARITINKKRKTIGYFPTKEEAVEAYKKELKKFWEKQNGSDT